MLTTLLEQVGKVRENRLLLVGFLPTLLLLAAATTVYTHATGTGTDLLDWWENLSGSAQALVALGVAAALYIVASVAVANTTRIIQMFEGLPWKSWWWPGGVGVAAHAYRRGQGDVNAYAAYVPAPPGSTSDLLPTGVGNALFAGERHGYRAFGIQPAALWSRLVSQMEDKDTTKLDDARTSLDFLVVICSYATAFTAFSMVFLSVHGSGWPLYAIAVGSGGVIALLSYVGAEQAALALGVLIASAFDTDRNKVLTALRLPLPSTPTEEKQLWAAVDLLIRRDTPPAGRVYQAPTADE